jgi:EAL domain-containing protein (putative c-di-GMP-specific phosphodiesterase class I)
VAATSALITAITSHMLHRLPSGLSGFDNDGAAKGYPVSFNVVARDLQDDTFVTTMVEALQGADMHAGDIEVEITGNDALTGGERLMHHLSVLQDAGISLTMDGYGTGYSSIDSLSV